MQRSAEVRWFFAGAAPSEVREWFCKRPTVATAAARTDEYLAFPTATIGVKFREGNFEIKGLVEDCGVRSWAAIEGRVQTWAKWFCAAPEVAALRRRVVRQRPPVVAVTKARSVRRFSLDRGLREIAADTTRFPADGSTVELTEIRVGRARHWTLGFESFARAHPARITEVLHQTVERLFDDRAAPRLRHDFAASNSLSYPEWLLTLTSRRRPGTAGGSPAR